VRDASTALEEAFAHDRAGREAEAIPRYEEALALGLADGPRQQALLGLGSSLRNVRRHREAIEVLRAAAEEYPDHAGLRFFLALALWSGGVERDAFRTMGAIALETADLRGYGRAATWYLEHDVD
jgi:tetratricopeptide (TPR) repeat protein